MSYVINTSKLKNDMNKKSSVEIILVTTGLEYIPNKNIINEKLTVLRGAVLYPFCAGQYLD